jgi:SAM-dependent methyltransferase
MPRVQPPGGNLPSQSPTETYNRDFADHYDHITQHKDYVAEVETLSEFIRDNIKNEHPKVLDVGCGTGSHAVLLAERGFDVTGIDLSPDMIRVALSKQTKARFLCGEMSALPDAQFQFAYSLFNVVNCLDTHRSLITFLSEISAKLERGGMLLFECWNPIAIIAKPPEVVARTFEAGGARIVRRVTPAMDLLRQRLDLEYHVEIYEGPTKRPAKSFTVIHNLTLFTPIEIELCLEQTGFKRTRMYTALPEMGVATADDRMLAFSCEK